MNTAKETKKGYEDLEKDVRDFPDHIREYQTTFEVVFSAVTEYVSNRLRYLKLTRLFSRICVSAAQVRF